MQRLPRKSTDQIFLKKYLLKKTKSRQPEMNRKREAVNQLATKKIHTGQIKRQELSRCLDKVNSDVHLLQLYLPEK